jgi:hypothetical protein
MVLQSGIECKCNSTMIYFALPLTIFITITKALQPLLSLLIPPILEVHYMPMHPASTMETYERW